MSAETMGYYREIAELWGPRKRQVPHPEVAVAACRALVRELGLPAALQVRMTSGNRYSRYAFHGSKLTLTVNPTRGWGDMVHEISHDVHLKLHRKRDGEHRHHGPRHALLERRMVRHAIDAGLVDAQPKPAKPKPDPQHVRAARVAASIERWEAKERRAKNALAKLRKQARYYERALAARQGEQQ